MKKIFNYLAAMLLLITGFTACNTDSEVFREMGYNQVRVTFNPAGLGQEYRATLDGQEIGFSGAIVPKGVETGELEIFRVSDGVSVFKEEVSTAEPIEFIKPIDKELTVYEEGKYIEFTPAGLWDASAPYQFRFKEWNMVSGTLNYIPLAELPGEVTVVDKNNGDAVLYSYNLTETSPTSLTLLQAGTDFVAVTEDNEPEPTIPNTAKVRFLYTGDDVLTMDEITFNLYFTDVNWDWVTPPTPYALILKRGEISEYVEFDLTDIYNNYYFYSIDDYKTGNILYDFDTCVMNFSPVSYTIFTDDWGAVKYKKATIQIMDGGNVMTVLDGLSTKW